MDNREVALELLKLYLQYHRERIELDQLVEAYMAILAALEGALPPQATGKTEDTGPSEKTEEDDSLFDFKEPLSLSDKEA